MGFFNRFTSKKPTDPAPHVNGSTPEPLAQAAGTGVKPKLVAAREKLGAKDLAGAIAIYEEVLAAAGDRADVLVTISGDLGTHGYVAEIIELIAPRYDAERHGPATGLNLLQAYLAVQNVDAAQHVLDILFSLKRPELEERLHGFSNAIAEMMTQPPGGSPSPAAAGPAAAPQVGLVTISKPVWFYGLEALGDQLLPAKEGKLRRIAFAQLAYLNVPDFAGAINQPEDEIARLTRALPLWLAESFTFTANYSAVAALGIFTPPDLPARHMIFAGEWTTENLRQLVDTHQGGLDYIVTGALRVTSGDYELVLRLYEVKSFRERKRFTTRWTPATADVEMAKLHAEVRRFMECAPATAGLKYEMPGSPRAWLETLGASASLFLADKGVVTRDLLRPVSAELEHAGRHAAGSDVASLAFLTLRARGARLGAAAAEFPLSPSPVVQQARQALG